MTNQIRKILDKLKISELNEMQKEALSKITNHDNTMVLSPTGSGKTLGFLLPLLGKLDPDEKRVQALILVPSRELAIQIEQVFRDMGTGFKVNAVYGGRSIAKDKIELQHNPAVLIGTPGRIADHFERDQFSKTGIKTLVLDEFDKSLEIGFENDMNFIISELNQLKTRVLTSATNNIEIPKFVGFDISETVNYLKEGNSKLTVEIVLAKDKNKFKSLLQLINFIGNKPGIIFCNFKDSIGEVSAFLRKHKIEHGCFYGGMEQKERERALIKFRNGTHQIIVATDLAARGLDIPELGFIIHYELPIKSEEFTHRNGRTARVQAEGTAYVLKWEEQRLPDFIEYTEPLNVSDPKKRVAPYWDTLFISGGRKDKISKGDIAGLFFKTGHLNNNQLGVIELKQDCAFVAVPKTLSSELIFNLNNTRLKKKKVRIYKL
ncbi:MAG: helicase [Bacteroidetes bacterium MedPE-SWsnd-G2]|nr:MAG: helicase [Bacteroidetes bacterium MedPE-SWsnd-G2]